MSQLKSVKLPNISVKEFNVIIKYIYSGKISIEKLENSVIFGLLIASNELKLDEHLQSHLVNNNASWLRLKFAQIYLKSYQVKNFKIIQDFCDNIISKHPKIIFESENFHSLPEDILISILKRDDLQLEEGKIWEYVIEWGKAKNQLPTNLDKWTSDNFLSLKETLKGCLPHISYFSFSNEDVVEKIYPYQKLLEYQLFSDINVKFNIPNKKIPLSSDIITNEHALEISSRIDRREIPYIENNPYEFQLLVRGSRNEFDVNKVSKTIIILKVEGTGEILGRFNPFEWDKNRNLHKLTKDSFVFSLKTANLKNSILCRFDWQLKTEKRCYCMKCETYFKPIRSGKFTSPSGLISEKSLFSVEEYEVSKILPRK
ncbi:hypothetical protein Glove_159g19 [Diversispora epigaea]|uniref:BACK domain-containing protein n=1 Tax=Diversispora epigaea TaxID=1348612 RepID=A0A397IRL0_9GLOM|nr:hypothetical protein Glove_159g19 [Diversispora epigaea]